MTEAQAKEMLELMRVIAADMAAIRASMTQQTMPVLVTVTE